jgi:hypothetical protein
MSEISSRNRLRVPKDGSNSLQVNTFAYDSRKRSNRGRGFAMLIIPVALLCCFFIPFNSIDLGSIEKKEKEYAHDLLLDDHKKDLESIEKKEKKYAYALLLDQKGLECPARIMSSRLKRLDPHSDIVVFVARPSPTSQLDVTINDATRIVHMKTASNLGRWQWKNTFLKFESARLHEYDAVMFLDMDNLVLQSPRYLFDVLMSTSSDVAVPEAYWLNNNFIMTGGPMIFRPSTTLDNRVSKVLDADKAMVTHDSEMDWFNEEFKQDAQVLDYMISDGIDNQGEEVQKLTYVLNDEFKNHDDLFKLGKMMGFQHPSQVLEKATMVHFIAKWKPYQNAIREIIESGDASKELKYLISLYDAEKMLVC